MHNNTKETTMDATETKVQVLVNHRTSRPHSWWVTPAGWEPALPDFAEENWLLEGGTLWSDTDEEASLALFSTEPLSEGDKIEVALWDLDWLSSGDCRTLGDVTLED